jgi:hypothetical protein
MWGSTMKFTSNIDCNASIYHYYLSKKLFTGTFKYSFNLGGGVYGLSGYFRQGIREESTALHRITLFLHSTTDLMLNLR